MDRHGLELALRDLAGSGSVTRRELLRRAAGLGLTAPSIAALLAACGGGEADSTAESAFQGAASGTTPTTAAGGNQPSSTGNASPSAQGQRGGGGTLRLLWWQAPTIINPHLAQGTKDFDASNIVLEALAYVDIDGNLIPRLAEEVPSVENGGVSEDGREVTWKLRKGIKWHDGEEFTANDVKFTYEYVIDKATAATTYGNYESIEAVEIVDDYTVKVSFKDPNPAWFVPFVGGVGLILPEHVLRDFVGEKARNAEFNLKPIGTGPYRVAEFRPGDVVIYEINQDYWQPGKPFFDRIEMKGGGDATGAARAVLQTGDADWAWNLQVEAQVLESLQEGGAGKLVITPGTGTERIMVNFTDPNKEVNGARSELANPHPFLTEKRIRQAIALAIQRDVIVDQLYGPSGAVTANNLNAPKKFQNPNLTWEFNLEKAEALLDEAGAVRGPSGTREFNGVPLHMLYQTSVNPVRQKNQEIVKAALEQIGFTVELKSVDSKVFFDSSAGNPDTYGHFYADIEMYNNGPSTPYPIDWARRYLSTDVAQASNQWSGANITRYQNPEYDAVWEQARTELDPDKQIELFHKINEIATNDVVEIPIVHRAGVAAAANSLTGYNPSTWESDVYDIGDWRRE